MADRTKYLACAAHRLPDGAAAAQYVARISLENAVQQVIVAETTPEQTLAGNSGTYEILANLAVTEGTLMLEIGRGDVFPYCITSMRSGLGNSSLPVLNTMDMPEEHPAAAGATLGNEEDYLFTGNASAVQTIGLPGYSSDRVRYEIQSSDARENAMLPVSYLSVSDFREKTWRSLLCIDHYDEHAVIFEYGSDLDASLSLSSTAVTTFIKIGPDCRRYLCRTRYP